MSYEVMKQVDALLQARQVVFWDFDGVIKDSVMVKSEGYEKLFLSYGENVVRKVRQHHNANGGISRYEKIPLYLEWADELASTDLVRKFCRRFSDLVQQAVIDSPWVPGVREYLEAHHTRQYFVLMTATPQAEIEQILQALEISSDFREIYGAPTAKAAVICDVLKRLRCPPEQALVVGDSDADFSAAEESGLSFLLRSTPFNQDLQKRFKGPSFERLNF
jgi:phosphoglycolate phosphatase-like HAD superfamily hydrolase